MKKLKTEFQKYGFTFRQVWRDEKYAIYGQLDGYEVIAFEVIKVGHQRAGKFPDGREIEAGERYPSSEQWGSEAKTVSTFPRALEVVELWRQAERLPVIQ